MAIYQNILETIGHTPVVRLNRLAPPGVNLYVKVEAFNPMGSVKDRLARGVIEAAERSGELQPGQTVIEASSGNTGIGLAMVCAQKGYPLVIVMAENFSIERRKLMRFLGARVVLTPAAEKGTGMLAKAVELAEAHGYFLCRQFENEANAIAHATTTAPEILADFAAIGLDYWVTGFGTGGTLKGVAQVLKTRIPRTRIIACEPDNSPVLGSGISQPRLDNGMPAASHPVFRPHLMQGWSPDFIAKLTEDAVSQELVDEIIAVKGADALALSRRLATEEGIFVGISAGATLAAALQVAGKATQGSNILCMLPDTGERYLTTPLFEAVNVDMNDEEMALSRSTPGFRFDIISVPVPAPASLVPATQGPVTPSSTTPATHAAEEPPVLDQACLDEVKAIIADPDQPVVMFALEWCEFCWSVRKLFNTLGVAYRSVDLDSVAFQRNDRGGKIRAVLAELTGRKTIPQIFIGGRHIGGCSELFDHYRQGSLDDLLSGVGIPMKKLPGFNPDSLLPGWIHQR